MSSTNIVKFIILAIGLVLAVIMGNLLVTDLVTAVAYLGIAAVVIVCVAMGRKIWLLIPLAVTLNIGIRLPGAPSSLILSQIVVTSFALILLLMRKLPFKLKWTELEFWVFLLTALILQAWLRHPTGIKFLGGGTVGGKPYFLYFLALACSLLLSGLLVDQKDLKWMMRLSILGMIGNAAIGVLGKIVPGIAYVTGATYDNADAPNFEDRTADDPGRMTRVGFLSELGRNTALWVSSMTSPLRALVKPTLMLLVVLSAAAAMMGGFRNGVAAVVLVYLLGVAYWNGFPGVIAYSFAGLAGVALLAVVNVLHPLPPNVQRSLTFLPGTWEQRYRDDAEGSTEWRIEIWKEALLTDRWIKNKVIGDGLGFSYSELAAQMTDRKGARAGISGFEAHRETILANGDYHSGPVSAIRTVGYVGMIIFVIALIRLAVHAHRQIQRCRGTPWFPMALFYGIPLISSPFTFVFVFGSFKEDMAGYLIGYAFIRLLENNLPLPAYTPRRREPYILATRGPRAVPAAQSARLQNPPRLS